MTEPTLAHTRNEWTRRYTVTGWADRKAQYSTWVFRPETVGVTIRQYGSDGYDGTVAVTGPRVLKDGGVSPHQSGEVRYYGLDDKSMPDEVRAIVAAALPTMAGLVQA